jgi:hypothetical protein
MTRRRLVPPLADDLVMSFEDALDAKRVLGVHPLTSAPIWSR